MFFSRRGIFECKNILTYKISTSLGFRNIFIGLTIDKNRVKAYNVAVWHYQSIIAKM
jgi:hypothetical protein